jgi:hypothetical protein
MKLTRRQLAALISSTATAAALSEVPAQAQPQAQSQPQTPPRPAGAADEIDAARQRLKANSDLLAQQELPMATEPAFQFKA